MNQDRFFDLKGLAEYSCLSIKTLRNHLGKLAHYKIGGKLLVRKSDFDEYLKQYRVIDNLDEVVEEIVNDISTSN